MLRTLPDLTMYPFIWLFICELTPPFITQLALGECGAGVLILQAEAVETLGVFSRSAT